MFIQTETTPNPDVLKFLPGREVLDTGAREFRDVGEAQSSPLAASIFALGDVTRVFFGSDFITVMRSGEIGPGKRSGDQGLGLGVGDVLVKGLQVGQGAAAGGDIGFAALRGGDGDAGVPVPDLPLADGADLGVVGQPFRAAIP